MCLERGDPFTPKGRQSAAKNPTTETKKMTTQKRTKQIILRVNAAELDELNCKKNRPELARWIRETALATEQPKRRISPNSQFPPELAKILAGMGNNLNQIAKQLNSAAKIGTLGNVEAIKALTQLNALEHSLNALRQHLAQKPSRQTTDSGAE